MQNNTRTINSLKNMISGVGGQALYTVLKLVSRYMFIKALGEQYLGVNGLFTNIITVLSISELGLGSAIVFAMYKPIAERDEDKINALMYLYKKAYTIIGSIIFILGLALIPGLNYLVDFGESSNYINIYLVYIMFLLETSTSYWFFEYKKSFLFANQKNYIVNSFDYVCKIIFTIIQMVVIWDFSFFDKSMRFYLFTLFGIIGNIASKFLIRRYTDKHYPYQSKIIKGTLSKAEKKSIVKNVFSISLHRICTKIMNSIDNIVISAFMIGGTLVVGVYSNYTLITVTIAGFTQQVINSVTAALGDKYANDSKESNEFIFKCMDLINTWMYAFCSICMWILVNPFLDLMFGQKYVLSQSVLFLICYNFLVVYQLNPTTNYRYASGIHWHGKYVPLATIAINVVLSLALVKPLGIFGVLFATAVSNTLTTYWVDPILVYKHAFNMSSKGYFKRLLINDIFIFALAGFITLITLPFAENTWSNFAIKFIVVVLTNVAFLLKEYKTKEFKFCKNLALSLIKKNKS